ncbi:MAG: hypothetical protein U0326_13525 [Polyangiales bacterium]
MPDLDPIRHDLTPAPQGAGVFDKPSWLRAHALLVAIVTALTLVLFAVFVMQR